jgi:hypothetical protein
LSVLLLIDDLPIRLSADGRWLHGDEALHPKVAILFAKCLIPKENGEYELHVGQQKSPVLVSDVGFFVRSIRVVASADGEIEKVELKISDGTTQLLEPGSLMMSEENALYCRIQRHGFEVPCKFTAQQYHELALQAEFDGEFALLNVSREKYRLNNVYDSVPRKLQ